MALSLNLEKGGHPPRKIRPTTKAKLEPIRQSLMNKPN
jgi:hypothetical protein